MYRFIIDWAEVIAPLIALPFVLSRKTIPAYLKPVRIYVAAALILNVAATLIWKYKERWGFQEGDFLWSNNFIYNIHSIVRLLLFSWFFILLKQRFLHRVKLIIPALFLVLAAINFIFFENFLDRTTFSNRLLATEAAILLFYCLQYFIFLNLEDRVTALSKQPGFWVVTGLTFYVAASFFIYLFYIYLTAEDLNFAVDIWDVHNIMYIFLCICIAVNFKLKNVK
ncbi:MAG: hypothetical protein ACT4OJ_00865 [Bacteroidota bacterium]